MITEDYVTYEVGLLLREKGFDEICEMFYCKPNEGYKNNLVKREWRNSALREDMVCTCPTVYLAMKWLREIHNIDIDIKAEVGMLQVKRYVPVVKTYHPKYDEELGRDRLNQKSHSTSKPLKGEMFPVYEDFATYEEACNEAINYCLEKLI